MRLAVCSLILLLSGGSALAEDDGNGGEFRSSFTQNGNVGTRFSSDVSYSFGGRRLAPGLSIGIELNEDSNAEIFGSFDVGYADITLSVGRPRTAFYRLQRRDRVLPLSPEHTDENLRFGVGIVANSEHYGYGASWHLSEEDTDVLGVRAGYEREALEIYGGALSAGDTTFYRLGSSFSFRNATAGVDLLHDEIGNGQTAARVFMDYAISDKTTVGLIGFNEELGTERGETSLGVTAAYDVGKGFLKGGVATAPNSETRMGVSVGFRF